MTPVCEHVPYDATEATQVVPGRPTRDHFLVQCPCCGMTGWSEGDQDLSDVHCPHCAVRAVKAEDVP